jgi:hypothetical protein
MICDSVVRVEAENSASCSKSSEGSAVVGVMVFVRFRVCETKRWC